MDEFTEAKIKILQTLGNLNLSPKQIATIKLIINQQRFQGGSCAQTLIDAWSNHHALSEFAEFVRGTQSLGHTKVSPRSH